MASVLLTARTVPRFGFDAATRTPRCSNDPPIGLALDDAVRRRALGVGRVWLIGSLVWGGFGVRSDHAYAVTFDAARLNTELTRLVRVEPLATAALDELLAFLHAAMMVLTRSE